MTTKARRQPCGLKESTHSPRSILTHVMQPDGAPMRPLLPRNRLEFIRVELVHQLHCVRHVLPAESGSRISSGREGSGGSGGVAAAAGARRSGRNDRQQYRAASRATRCWAGGQALSRWGGRCKHAFGAASRPKALAVSVTIWCSSSIVSWPSQSTSNRLKVVSVASLSGSGIALNCSDSLGSRI